MDEGEKARKLALLPRWEQVRSQYEAKVLELRVKQQQEERDSLWLQFPEESLLRMIGDYERKIKELEVQSTEVRQEEEPEHSDFVRKYLQETLSENSTEGPGEPK